MYHACGMFVVLFLSGFYRFLNMLNHHKNTQLFADYYFIAFDNCFYLLYKLELRIIIIFRKIFQ